MNASLPLSVSPRIAPLFRLQYEPAQEAWVLLYPEGMVRLNTPAAEILRRCDGQRDVAAIIADLEQCFQQTGLADDVQSFLGQAGEHGWLV
ncbi:pyrroloquinoline quinone biosynthesis peptide chaperone PqqD [Ideonella sp. B7]|uniref:pyrroloquinoline quinone biosynthesis peptide chaperone PqqD n=1 Tax=Ideonella benzenivorans TaxID=2831643 RepID=UPI001CEC8C1B|nr:pyrroloquinoline quinone biosynthesis peptide chaperone PqqD [Ideonella benzenivorans]MCA6217284.1 pyrroloquinoline quinone biosynthesis peptide chaperone PqqD [Ideonella benzenivorans]